MSHSDRTDSADYRALFLSDAPLLDARAPVEFAKGAFPGALNLPLMNDAEREQVGTCYAKRGQQAAIDLGHRLVSGAIKAERIAAWAAFAREHPEGFLYCFRGGLRSQIVQQWLQAEAGITYPRVIGGYKAMRAFLLETMAQALAQCDFVVVGGLTGSGKTDLIVQLSDSLDLEAHARHRGSTFGKRIEAQPAQIDFENRIAIDMLKKRANGRHRFVLEDEGRFIGRCSLPPPLYQRMQEVPLVWLNDSLPNRVERIARDYVAQPCAELVALHGQDDGFQRHEERLLQSLDNIRQRLGGERHQRLRTQMQLALARQKLDGSTGLHEVWIESLLREYFDPMYDYQRASKAPRLRFSGTHAELRDYLRDRAGQQA